MHSKSTFIAMTTGNVSALGIRCFEGEINLVLLTKGSNASVGDPAELKIVVDASPVREEENAAMVEASNSGTGIPVRR